MTTSPTTRMGHQAADFWTSNAWGTGINFAGYLRTESGVGTAARGYVRALRHLGVPLALNDLSHLQGNRSEDRSIEAFDDAHPYDLNVICADVELHHAIVAHVGHQAFKDRYTIGIWAWELPRFPRRWYDRFAYCDEIWVGTSFIANTVALSSPIPVVRIPPVLTPTAVGSRERGRQRLGIAPDETVFSFIFDVHSHLPRKNPLGTIDAFKLAFSPHERARLIIKCVNGASDPAGLAAMHARAAGHRISIYDGYWPAEEIRDLMAACDAYVSLHRSEGTGLTITDALALGKPVIATAWSGNMDFMSPSNSFPVRYELVELRANVGPYRAGELWAEPSVAHAASGMRWVFEHPEEAAERGRLAQREIGAAWSEARVAELIGHRLETIGVRRQLSTFQEAMWANRLGYHALGERLRDAVCAVVPPGSTVMVVSKGDAELVRLPGRRGRHFPCSDDGQYAGWYPADSSAAIEHLERLRAAGGQFFVVPQTAFWWLDHYVELRQHLMTRYRKILEDQKTCMIFALSDVSQ